MIMMITIIILYSDQTKAKKHISLVLLSQHFLHIINNMDITMTGQIGHIYFHYLSPKKVLFLLRLNSRMIRSSKLTYLPCVRVSSKMRKKLFPNILVTFLIPTLSYCQRNALLVSEKVHCLIYSYTYILFYHRLLPTLYMSTIIIIPILLGPLVI